MFEQTESGWQKVVAEITSGLKEWVLQHPKATLTEIELGMMRRMGMV